MAKSLKQQLEDKTQEANSLMQKVQQLGQQNQQLQQQLQQSEDRVSKVKAQAFDQTVESRAMLSAAQKAIEDREQMIANIGNMVGVQHNEQGAFKLEDLEKAIQALLPAPEQA